MKIHQLATFVLLTCLASVCAESAQADAANDSRADEAVTLFEKYCVVNGGTRAEAEKLLSKTPIAKPLPENVVMDLQSGRKGGIGWLIQTPHNGRVILAYDPIGVCEAAVVAADGNAMRRAFQAMINEAGKQLNIAIVAGEAQTTTFDGSQIIATPFAFPFLGKTTTLTLTIADKTMPIGFQHTMTSTFTKL